MAERTITIELDDNTQRFYQGVASADEVRKAHAVIDFPDFETEARVFWFYVGVLAGGRHEVTSEEEFAHFVAGAATRAPSDSTDD